MTQPQHSESDADASACPVSLAQLMAVRAATERLLDGLTPEDQNLQSMPEASPAKWHRAHTSWFFETFVLGEHLPGYRCFDPAYAELFNSYYNGIGRQHPRAKRSLLSRPDAQTIGEYRAYIDSALTSLFETSSADLLRRLSPLLALGIAHEQQHQELILTDLKHALSFNPLAPSIGQTADQNGDATTSVQWQRFVGGIHEIGADDSAFCFDNETPRHRVLLSQDFELASRPVTIREYADFMADGGYEEPLLWLSDGWSWAQENRIRAPLYWRFDEGQWQEFTLTGWRAPDPAAPVCHISFYEACAYASWVGVRLPTEAEWEVAASNVEIAGQFADSGCFHPQSLPAKNNLNGMFGSVWEWTTSSYGPYPGFKPEAGAIGEYNGKFMANQMVLRGGSCATPAGHVRKSYRNFFYPADRWQFSGLRLARDA